MQICGAIIDPPTAVGADGGRFSADIAEVVHTHLNEAACDVATNYFNLPVQIDDSDFVGLDEADLIKPREPNGDLPRSSCLRLAKGSDLIDRGVDVGLLYHGAAPDLGAFEYIEY